MTRTSHRVFAILAAVLLGLWVRSPSRPPAESAAAGVAAAAQRDEVRDGQAGGATGPAAPGPAGGVVARDTADLSADRRIFTTTMERALRERLDTLPIGDRMVHLGIWFVGAAYVPKTLEADGPEHLVVNLRQFDCVTYLENMLAMARVLGTSDVSFDAFLAELRRIRYRGGVLDGYASRLHYFSEWISDNESKGIVREVTREIGGVPLDEPIDFMSTHAGSYRQLGSSEELERIKGIERTLSERARFFIPKEHIASVAARIQNGDIIAATSSIRGLDVAHTGMAIWIDGRLHLMHAPLVGKDVQISELPLADRILGIKGQNGIMVARPL